MEKQLFFDRLTDYTSLSEECRHALLDGIKVLHFTEARSLQPTGQSNRQLVYVLGGIVRSYIKTNDGLDVTQEFYCAEDLVMANYGIRQLSEQHLESLSDLCVVTCSLDHIETLLPQYPELFYVISGCLQEELRRNRRRTAYMDATEPVSGYRYFVKCYPEVEHQVSENHIASFLGLSDQELDRVRQLVRHQNRM